MIEERADRLEANFLMYGLVRQSAEDALEGTADARLLEDHQWDAWRDSDDEDVRLVVACARAEYERRRRQWQALEFLAHVTNAPSVDGIGDGDDERAPIGATPGGAPLVLVSRAEAVAVASSVLGWDLKPPA